MRASTGPGFTGLTRTTLLCVLVLALAPSRPGLAQSENPLTGVWHNVHGVYVSTSGDTVVVDHDGRPFSVSLFTPTHFSFISLNLLDSLFSRAAAGTYRLEGDRYTQVFNWDSVKEKIGVTATWEMQIEGDTLVMSGPLRVVEPDGREWEKLPHYVERKVRVE